jgi:CHAT domain-containing protein
VVKPLERDLQKLQTEAILYAPDGVLRYVPIAAFHDGDDWLIQRYRINNWTSASVMDLGTSIQDELKIFGGAYTSGTHTFAVADQNFTFFGLPFAGQEMTTLGELFQGTLSFRDDEFVFNNVYPERSGFNVLHLATHAAAVVGQPSDSFILFGDGGRLSIQEIKNLDFDLDLAVLSACETALGDTLSNGVEVLGLGYAMQQSGVRATIASLWSVSDGGTHALMSEFYRQLLEGKNKAEALQLAQQLLISNDAEAISAANRGVVLADAVTSRLAHPFYWAPFIIVGSGL